MNKILVLITACIVSTTAFSAQIDTSGLTDSQVQELRAHAAKVASDNMKKEDGTATSSNPSTIMTLAATWGQQAATAAEGFAKALGIAAKELNINVNQFIDTPAGKLTVIIIIWKVFGVALLKFFIGIVVWIVAFCISRQLARRVFLVVGPEIEVIKYWGLVKTKQPSYSVKSISDLKADGEWFVFMLALCVAIVGLFIGTLIII